MIVTVGCFSKLSDVRNQVVLLMTLAGGLVLSLSHAVHAQTKAHPTLPPNRIGHVLVISETKGYEHDSVPDAMAAVYQMGHDSKLWEATLRTDTELLTKTDPKARNIKSLDYFDVVVFASTTGELALTDDQKKDLLSFVKEDGKGFVGIHAALDTNYKWPEYGEMIGG